MTDREAEILRRLGRSKYTLGEDDADLDECPATQYQQGIWLLDQLDAEKTQYVVSMCWDIERPLDPARMANAWRLLGSEQAALRAKFHVVAGELRLRFRSVVPELEVIQSSDLPAACVRPLDLNKGLVSRATLTGSGSKWRLQVDVHHIVFDDPSAETLASRLFGLYADDVEKGRASKYATLNSQSVAQVAKQFQENQRFWKGHLSDTATEVGIRAGSDGSPPSHTKRVPADASVIDQLLRSEPCRAYSPLAVLMSLWVALLHNVGSERELVVGTPVSQRTSAHDGTIGLFLNTVPVRTSPGEITSFSELAKSTHQSLLTSLDHSDIPYPEIVRAVAARGTGESVRDVFSSWFAIVETATGPDKSVTRVPVSADAVRAKFPLGMYAIRSGDGWALEVEADGDRFPSKLVQDLADRAAALISLVAADPTMPYRHADLLRSASEPRSAETPPQGSRLDHFFRHAVESVPEHVAIVSDEGTYTYAEFDKLVDHVAARLQRAGLQPSDRLAVAMRRSPLQVATVLAALRMGATYVPLDLDSPVERIRRILAVAEPRLTATDQELLELGSHTRVLNLGSASPRSGEAPPPTQAFADGPSAAAYITFTSGSTGLPKGILMPHSAVLNLVDWQTQFYPEYRSNPVVLQHASLSFDVSAQEIFGSFSASGTLVLLAEGEQRDVAAIARRIVERGVEILYMPAPALRQLVKHCLRSGVSLPLKLVVSGSEQLILDSEMRQWLKTMPTTRLFNEYGPSETHVATWHEVSIEQENEWVPIGRPIRGAELTIRNPHDGLALRGAEGELHISGAGLGWGYVAQPEATARAWVPVAPPGDDEGKRAYRTGDLVRENAAGDLIFVGRTDGQVKVRGYRIETNEVRLAVNSHPTVEDSHVLKFELPSSEAALAAYVVARTGTTPPGMDVLRQHVLQTLPSYMCPRVFLYVGSLPLNVNRKVDIDRLPPVSLDGGEGAQESHPPVGHLERSIASIFGDILSRGTVGRDDNFFALGGSSLSATQAAWNVEEKLATELPIAVFYAEPTPKALAEFVQAQIAAKHGGESRSAHLGDANDERVQARVADILNQFREGN